MYITLALAVVAVLLIAGGSLSAADFRVCEDCHFERLEQDRGQVYQHQAFAGYNCTFCHVSAAATSSEGQAQPLTAQQQRIRWLSESIVPDTSHYFLLAAEGLRDTLVIRLRDQQGQVVREEMSLPYLAQLESAEDSGRTPQLANVRVVEVKRGIFLSVTIAWQTDELAAAEVRYGTAEMNQQVDSGGRLGYQHQLVLQQLQPNKTYRYQVISRDLFGRESASEIMTFSTERMMPRQAGSESAVESSDAPIVLVDVRRRGDDYLFEVQLDQPRVVCVGSKGRSVEQQRGFSDARGNAQDDPHAGLSDNVWSSMDSCRQCHDKYEETSHPVNVLPPPGMKIPADYPTLADGRMTCASCHAIHGSNQEFMTRQRSKKELCVGCHLDML